jgi:DNA-binding NtrC family response regulator
LSTNSGISLSNIYFSSRKKLSKYISLEVGASLEDAERELIIRTLEEADGNKQKAAGILGITTKTIRAKLRHYGYDQYNNDQETVDA